MVASSGTFGTVNADRIVVHIYLSVHPKTSNDLVEWMMLLIYFVLLANTGAGLHVLSLLAVLALLMYPHK
jgi:hypothetical protein